MQNNILGSWKTEKGWLTRPAIKEGIKDEGNQVVIGVDGIDVEAQSVFVQVDIVPNLLRGLMVNVGRGTNIGLTRTRTRIEGMVRATRHHGIGSGGSVPI